MGIISSYSILKLHVCNDGDAALGWHCQLILPFKNETWITLVVYRYIIKLCACMNIQAQYCKLHNKYENKIMFEYSPLQYYSHWHSFLIIIKTSIFTPFNLWFFLQWKVTCHHMINKRLKCRLIFVLFKPLIFITCSCYSRPPYPNFQKLGKKLILMVVLGGWILWSQSKFTRKITLNEKTTISLEKQQYSVCLNHYLVSIYVLTLYE